MLNVFLLILVAILQQNAVFADYGACVNQCNNVTHTEPTTIICGNDNNTYTIIQQFGGEIWWCYLTCQLTLQYPGQCGCPNFCYESLGYGKCVNNSCACEIGHGGADCLDVACPNNCSGHGRCVNQVCVCDSSWTAFDCGSPKQDLNAIPYGELLPHDRPYWYLDQYKDDHPVFDQNFIATVRIEMSQSDFLYLLDQNTINDQEWVPANATFDNGRVRQYLGNIGIRVKGAYTRTYWKKGWNININKFNESQNLLGLKKLGFKGADLIYIKNLLVNEFYRAMKVPASRSSIANLFINGVNWGLFWMAEDINEDFLAARYEDPNGDLFKCGYNAFLKYEGDSKNDYKGLGYELDSGNGDWKHLIEFIKVVTFANESEFVSEVQKYFDVDRFLRVLTVELFIAHWDGFAGNGNNYNLYFNPSTGRYEMFTWDFDFTFDYVEYLNIYEFREEAVLVNKILAVPEWKQLYTNYIYFFREKVFNSTALISKLAAYKRVLVEEAALDEVSFAQYGYPANETLFYGIEYLETFIQQRMQFLSDKIDANFTSVTTGSITTGEEVQSSSSEGPRFTKKMMEIAIICGVIALVLGGVIALAIFLIVKNKRRKYQRIE